MQCSASTFSNSSLANSEARAGITADLRIWLLDYFAIRFTRLLIPSANLGWATNRSFKSVSRRIHQFDAAVKRLIVSPLAERGFVSDKRRRVFRRSVEDRGFHLVQIIEFQIGSRSRSGYFTVNLGVFCREVNHGVPERSILAPDVFPDCFIEMTQRLGQFFDPPRSLLGKMLGLKRREPIDHWWTLEEAPG